MRLNCSSGKRPDFSKASESVKTEVKNATEENTLEELYKDMLNFVPSKRIKLNTILKRIDI